MSKMSAGARRHLQATPSFRAGANYQNRMVYGGHAEEDHNESAVVKHGSGLSSMPIEVYMFGILREKRFLQTTKRICVRFCLSVCVSVCVCV